MNFYLIWKPIHKQKGHREQFSIVSPLIDLSVIYGMNQQNHEQLRAFNDGRMLAVAAGTKRSKREYLPFKSRPFCKGMHRLDKCFFTGDSRTEDNLFLTTLNTIFIRLHNKIAMQLSLVNPNCNDERLFQETRKIMIGIYQHIIFKQWLPVLVGPKFYQDFGLAPLETGFFMGYDKNVRPNLYNELPTAAFRFGHTLVKEEMSKAKKSFALYDSGRTDAFIFSSNSYFKDGTKTSEDLARGLLADNCNSWGSVH